MEQKIYDLIDSYRDELTAMLKKWVRVPSVKSEGTDGAPFGKEIRRMLDMAMVDAETMGFMTEAYDGYACDILLGVLNEDRLCGVVRNIGREGQSHELMTLRELRDYDADMFCTVFIGNAMTRRIGSSMVTPRGYRDV